MIEPDAKPRVLLVDDDPDVRRLLRILEADGIEIVGEAANGAEALIQTLDLQPDVVILDVVMPVMDGIEAAEKIKAALPFTQIVMFTSLDEPEIGRSSRLAGVYAYLLKDSALPLVREMIMQAFHFKLALEQRAR